MAEDIVAQRRDVKEKKSAEYRLKKRVKNLANGHLKQRGGVLVALVAPESQATEAMDIIAGFKPKSIMFTDALPTAKQPDGAESIAREIIKSLPIEKFEVCKIIKAISQRREISAGGMLTPLGNLLGLEINGMSSKENDTILEHRVDGNYTVFHFLSNFLAVKFKKTPYFFNLETTTPILPAQLDPVVKLLNNICNPCKIGIIVKLGWPRPKDLSTKMYQVMCIADLVSLRKKDKQ